MRRVARAAVPGWVALCVACSDPSGHDEPLSVVDAEILADARVAEELDAAPERDVVPIEPLPPLRNEDASLPVPDACSVKRVKPVLNIPDLLLVLDRSGSMNPAENNLNADRWSGSTTALVEITAAFDTRVNFGLMTFPGGPMRDRNRDECATGVLNVPVAPTQAPAIAQALAAMNAGGYTPTAPTLKSALATLTAPSSATPDRSEPAKYVLLVTDGDPNCSGTSRTNVDLVARADSIAAVEALRSAGIQTFVIGYQTEGSEFAAQLDSMAAAGGTGATRHRSVNSGADLSATVSTLAGSVVSCTYALDVEVTDAKRVLVKVDGVQRDLNHADGWKLLSDARSVTLQGAACDAVRAGKLIELSVTCDEVIPL